MTNKKTLQRLKLDPYFSKSIDTNLNVWSHDVNSYEIKFEFYDSECDKPIDLTGADMRILLDHADSQPKVYPLEIESKILGLAKFIMPPEIRGCEGKFTAHIYADYPNKTHDFGSFVFKTNVSRIDKSLGGCLDTVYVSEFEKALKEIKDKNSQFHIIEGKLNDRIDVIEKDIASNEVAKQPEVDKLKQKIEDQRIPNRNYMLNSKGFSNINSANPSVMPIEKGSDETGNWIKGKHNNRPNLFEFNVYMPALEDTTFFTKDAKSLIGESFCVSVDVMCKESIQVYFQDNKKYQLIPDKWTRIFGYQEKNNRAPNLLSNGNSASSEVKLYHKNWKVDSGNVESDWMPASEDLTTKKETESLKEQIDEIKKAITTLGGTL